MSLSLRARLTLALVASLIAGAAATIAGASHLIALHAQGTLAFTEAVWTTLVTVALIANTTGLVVVILTTRTLGAGVRHLRDVVQTLTTRVTEHDRTTPLRVTHRALRPVHAAVHEARIQLHEMLDRVRMERDRTRAIIDTVSSAVFAVDGGGRIIHANDAAARVFDRPMHALRGVVLSDLIATESLQMTVDERGSVTFHGDPTGARFTTTFRVFGGRAFPADVAITPMPFDGQQAWAVFVHDRSAQQQAEAELRAARQTADDANRAKSAFLARIGAEFRAPLEATTGFTQTVLRSRGSQLSDRDRQYLERVLGATGHLQTLVGDILDLARIESGAIVLELARTNVNAVVESVLEEFDEQVAGRPVLLERVLPADAVFASVDAGRLRQVLTNLVSNAVKFTARGTVTVTVCRDGTSDHATAVIVRDTGIGISLERQAHIFELFNRPADDVMPRYGGSGLGLALSKRLATEMGCMLSVESMPGAGSTFTLAFAPVVPTAVTPRSVAHHA